MDKTIISLRDIDPVGQQFIVKPDGGFIIETECDEITTDGMSEQDCTDWANRAEAELIKVLTPFVMKNKSKFFKDDAV